MALFGLLFGWAFRGISLKGRARDAMVQRDIALTELDQTRLELDHLYAAQSKGVDAAAQAGDDTLRLELEAREEKLQVLSKELAASRDELEDLKSKAMLGTASAGAATAAVITAQDSHPEAALPEERLDAELNLSDASLKWQNRYLASRVRALEAGNDDTQDNGNEAVDTTPAEDPRVAAYEAVELRATEAEAALEAFKANAQDDQKQAIAAALAASAATAAASGALSGGSSEDATDKVRGDAIGNVKQAWQNNYLRQRLSFAQASLLPSSNEAEEIETPIILPELEVAEEALGAGDIQGEIQAWKTQHLQQRLLYLEEHPITDRVSAPDLETVSEALLGETSEQSAEDNESLADEADAEVVEETVNPGELEQELARLRWRNRYLEGRLAYIDGDAPKSDAELAAQSEAGLSDGVSLENQTSATDDAQEILPNTAEAVLAAMEGNATENEPDGAKPIALDKPETGRDDLTRIVGIDTDAACLLNEAGIWHFYQIAGWSPENVAWVNTLLGQDMRVQEQDWVAQAGALSLGADLG
jgi:predicted flap endonuclease-1-like 5' DNA nuclease